MGGTVAGAPVTWLLCSARKDSMSSVAGVSCAADQTQEKEALDIWNHLIIRRWLRTAKTGGNA
jgi:hypothetical protein